MAGRSRSACPSMFSLPFHDFDGVASAGDHIPRRTSINCKAGELQFQQLPALCLYPLCLLKSARISPRVVWRADNTCGKQSLKLNPTKGRLSIIVSISPLTHPRCHSLLLDKASGVLAARVLIHRSSQEHRSCRCHTGHSNSCQRVHYCRCGSRSGIPGLQGDCRAAQELEELGTGKTTLGKR